MLVFPRSSQRVELRARAAAGDLFAGEIVGGGEIGGEAGDDETGCGVEEDEVAAGAAFGAFEDVGEDGGVRRAIAAPKLFDGAETEADVARVDAEFVYAAIEDFADFGGTAEGEFVHTAAMHGPGAGASEYGECLGVLWQEGG